MYEGMISQKGATATSDAATPMSLSFIMPTPTSHTTTPQLRESEPAQTGRGKIQLIHDHCTSALAPLAVRTGAAALS